VLLLCALLLLRQTVHDVLIARKVGGPKHDPCVDVDVRFALAQRTSTTAGDTIGTYNTAANVPHFLDGLLCL
jgi:hypothetical protein